MNSIKLSKTENKIAKAKMHLHKFGREKLLSGDVISYEADDFSKAIGQPLYLTDGANQFSLLPQGSYSLADNTLFNVDGEGKLSKITQKGNGTSQTIDPENQKQLWSKARKDNAMDRNIVRDNGAPKATQLSRHREFVLYKFGTATIYGGQKIKFPKDVPTVGTSPLFEDSSPMPDGIYQVTDPAGSLTVKNGFVSVWSPVTTTQKPQEQKLSLNNAFGDSEAARKQAAHFANIDELNLSSVIKARMKEDYKRRIALGEKIFENE